MADTNSRIVATYQQLLANATHQLVVAETKIQDLQEELYNVHSELDKHRDVQPAEDAADDMTAPE